jgi:hypothetical protein
VRRIGRYILNGLTVLSVVLCVAMAVLWAADHGATASRELILGVPGGRAYGLIFTFDHLIGAVFRFHQPVRTWDLICTTDHGWSTGFYCEVFLYERHAVWSHLGHFGATAFDGRQKDELFRGAAIVMVPAWVPIVLCGIAPAFALRRAMRRWRRLRTGRCAKCGYDLRATPDRCPECGAVPKRSPASSPSRTISAKKRVMRSSLRTL